MAPFSSWTSFSAVSPLHSSSPLCAASSAASRRWAAITALLDAALDASRSRPTSVSSASRFAFTTSTVCSSASQKSPEGMRGVASSLKSHSSTSSSVTTSVSTRRSSVMRSPCGLSALNLAAVPTTRRPCSSGDSCLSALRRAAQRVRAVVRWETDLSPRWRSVCTTRSRTPVPPSVSNAPPSSFRYSSSAEHGCFWRMRAMSPCDHSYAGPASGVPYAKRGSWSGGSSAESSSLQASLNAPTYEV
mmetsp:Transcript_5987/g.20239  ORF Transcript_5987/g.20239 Transcript_5987/m.20239 type:complete len:246 (-) Transcript_5987:1521-2258(-)